MRLTPFGFLTTTHHIHYVCDREFFPDNCDCGFEEQHHSIRKRIQETFLCDYPGSIYSHYNQYMQGDADGGNMWWQVRRGPALPTIRETKEVMIRAIGMEKM